VPRILVIGSANVDFTVAVSRLPKPGETVTEGALVVNHGGKGANQAVAARRLGGDVRLIACVGDDDSGRGIAAALARDGVGVAGLAVSRAGATGTALIIVDADGRNQIAVAPGANRHLTVEHVLARREDFAWAEVVVCQLEVPLETVAAALAEARRHGATTILNPAPVPAREIGFWPLVDYVTPNAGEAERLTGVSLEDDASAARAAAVFRERGVATTVVTLGERGAILCGGKQQHTSPAFAVRAIDTTAAGDAFNGALALALTERRAVEDALRFASAAAALTCTRRGAQDSLPTRAEVDALLA
jgi:ribokinase